MILKGFLRWKGLGKNEMVGKKQSEMRRRGRSGGAWPGGTGLSVEEAKKRCWMPENQGFKGKVEELG